MKGKDFKFCFGICLASFLMLPVCGCLAQRSETLREKIAGIDEDPIDLKELVSSEENEEILAQAQMEFRMEESEKEAKEGMAALLEPVVQRQEITLEQLVMLLPEGVSLSGLEFILGNIGTIENDDFSSAFLNRIAAWNNAAFMQLHYGQKVYTEIPYQLASDQGYQLADIASLNTLLSLLGNIDAASYYQQNSTDFVFVKDGYVYTMWNAGGGAGVCEIEKVEQEGDAVYVTYTSKISASIGWSDPFYRQALLMPDGSGSYIITQIIDLQE